MKTCISTLPSRDSRLAAIAGRLAPAALVVLGLCAAVAAQQPYQMPTALGPVVLTSGSTTATISEPIEAVGKTILARRTLNTTAQLGTYSTDSTQGPSFFSAFISGTRATNITDPHLERGVSSTTRFYCTEAGPSGRLLQQITTGVTVTLATLPTTPSSNWRLQAVSRTNSRFVLYDAASGKIARYDASLSPAFLVLGTLAGADGFSLSPNGQRIVLRQPSGVPFSPSTIATMSAVTAGAITTALNSVIHGKACWLDDRYLGVVENVGTTNQLRRVDTANLTTSEYLTSAPTSIFSSSELAISDDHEWLTFVTQQVINGANEKVPAAMRLTNGVSTGLNGPGGSYVELGDYRWVNVAPASLNLSNWYYLGKPVICVPTVGSTPQGPVKSMRVVYHGNRAFQQAPEVFRADVTDDPLVVPRGVMGSTVAVTTQVEPFASLWGMMISFQRSNAQISLLPTAWNAFLLQNQATLFYAVPNAPAGNMASVPLTVPSDPSLAGIHMMFQGAWLTSQSNTAFFSHVAEYPLW